MLTIWKIDSTTRGEEIKALFVRNERPGFPSFFERVYRTLAAEGGASWIATDDEGAVVMHVALFPRSFRRDGRTFRAALLGDLMADVGYRDFWSPLKLFRRAVGDVKREGRLDFLYTDPSPNSIAIAKSAGFAPLGELRRYVAPVNPIYLALCGARSRTARLRAVCRDRLEPTRTDGIPALGSAADLRAERSAQFYQAHSGGELAPQPRYVLVHDGSDHDESPSALGMLAPTDAPDTAALIDFQWDESRLGVRSALHAVARAARSQGFRKLSCTTLDGSRFADSLAGYGFIGRECTQPIFVLGLRPSDPLPRAPDWMLTSLDGSAW